MQVQPLRGLVALGKLLWERRMVIQSPGRPETMVEICRLAEPVDPLQEFVVRMGGVTTRPMSEKEAKQRFLEEAVFMLKK